MEARGPHPAPTGDVQAAAERLRQAATLCRPCRSLRDHVGDDLALAFAVQRHVLELRSIGGATRIGGKVGRNRAGAGEVRSTGVLLDDLRVPDGTRVSTNRLLQPRVEVKLAATLLGDLPREDLGDPGLRDRVALSLVLEVADRRIEGAELSQADDICDNAGAGYFVLGADPVPAGVLGPGPLVVRLELDSELTWRGGTSVDAVLDDVRALAAAWAADQPLRAGDVVLTAAVGPSLPVSESQHYSAYAAALAPVTMGFTTSSRLATTKGHL